MKPDPTTRVILYNQKQWNWNDATMTISAIHGRIQIGKRNRSLEPFLGPVLFVRVAFTIRAKFKSVSTSALSIRFCSYGFISLERVAFGRISIRTYVYDRTRLVQEIWKWKRKKKTGSREHFLIHRKSHNNSKQKLNEWMKSLGMNEQLYATLERVVFGSVRTYVPVLQSISHSNSSWFLD